VVWTGILGDLVLPNGAFDLDRADEIRELAFSYGQGGFTLCRCRYRDPEVGVMEIVGPPIRVQPREPVQDTPKTLGDIEWRIG
jgi:hypothetical protein